MSSVQDYVLHMRSTDGMIEQLWSCVEKRVFGIIYGIFALDQTKRPLRESTRWIRFSTVIASFHDRYIE